MDIDLTELTDEQRAVVESVLKPRESGWHILITSGQGKPQETAEAPGHERKD